MYLVVYKSTCEHTLDNVGVEKKIDEKVQFRHLLSFFEIIEMVHEMLT